MDQQVSNDLLKAGQGYEELFVPALFEPWTGPVLAAAKVKTGDHVLDIACGTGVLTRRALAVTGAGGSVVGADPAPGMLAAAAQIEPSISWRLCSAEALDADSQAFDRVVCQFGMMFFADRQQAADEMFRVLKPGGTLAIATWRSIEHNPAYADVIAVLEEHVGAAAANALRLPYSLGNADDVVNVLRNSGFADVTVATLTEQARFPSTRHMVEAELRGWLPIFDIHLDEAHINTVLNAAQEKLQTYTSTSGEAVFATSAHVFSAQKR